eukprot:25356_1
MAAPSSDNNMSAEVDRLVMLFPSIERPTVKNILINECKGDTTKSIVILTKIQQFNQSMNKANVNEKTINSGESQPINATAAISPSQIPLQVVSHVQQPANSNQIQYSINNCCNDGGCNDCGCACCLMKPASYTKGLYKIDYKIYNLSFLIFSIFTFYPEISLYSLSASYQGLYLPAIGLIFIFIASAMVCFINNNSDIGQENKMGSIRGALFIFGGLLYLLGYSIHLFTIPNDEGYYWFFESDIFPEVEYMIGRGLFVSIHSIFIGYLYVTNNKLPNCCNDRIKLIRFWTFLFLIFQCLALCFLINIFYIIVFMALSPFVTIVTLFLNCCLIKKSNEAGGCNSGLSLGLIIVVSYYFQMFWYFLFIMISRLTYNNYNNQYEQPGWFVIWDLAILIFASFQLWILTRAMHPANANCGCIHDGTGDGDIMLTTSQSQQPTQIVMVVQQPQ